MPPAWLAVERQGQERQRTPGRRLTTSGVRCLLLVGLIAAAISVMAVGQLMLRLPGNTLSSDDGGGGRSTSRPLLTDAPHAQRSPPAPSPGSLTSWACSRWKRRSPVWSSLPKPHCATLPLNPFSWDGERVVAPGGAALGGVDYNSSSSAGSSGGGVTGRRGQQQQPQQQQHRQGRVPHLIHQTVRDKTNLSCEQTAAIRSWKRLNPGWLHVLYDDTDILEFMQRWYPELLPLFKGLSSGVERADLWRYLVLHAYGGVYADLDVVALKPMSDWDPEGQAEVLVGVEQMDDKTDAVRSFNQFVMAAAPCHPLLASVPLVVLNNVAAQTTMGSAHAAQAAKDAVTSLFAVRLAGLLKTGFNVSQATWGAVRMAVQDEDAGLVARTGPGAWSAAVEAYAQRFGYTVVVEEGEEEEGGSSGGGGDDGGGGGGSGAAVRPSATGDGPQLKRILYSQLDPVFAANRSSSAANNTANSSSGAEGFLVGGVKLLPVYKLSRGWEVAERRGTCADVAEREPGALTCHQFLGSWKGYFYYKRPLTYGDCTRPAPDPVAEELRAIEAKRNQGDDAGYAGDEEEML